MNFPPPPPPPNPSRGGGMPPPPSMYGHQAKSEADQTQNGSDNNNNNNKEKSVNGFGQGRMMTDANSQAYNPRSAPITPGRIRRVPTTPSKTNNTQPRPSSKQVLPPLPARTQTQTPAKPPNTPFQPPSIQRGGFQPPTTPSATATATATAPIQPGLQPSTPQQRFPIRPTAPMTQLNQAVPTSLSNTGFIPPPTPLQGGGFRPQPPRPATSTSTPAKIPPSSTNTNTSFAPTPSRTPARPPLPPMHHQNTIQRAPSTPAPPIPSMYRPPSTSTPYHHQPTPNLGPPLTPQHRYAPPPPNSAAPPTPGPTSRVYPPSPSMAPLQPQPKTTPTRMPPGSVPPPPAATPSYPSQSAHATPKQPNYHQNSTPTLDPKQIPRPPLFTRPQDHDPVPIYMPRRSLESTDTEVRFPFEADSRFLSVDDGNAAPPLIRSTLYAVPRDRGVWRKTGNIEMGVICIPLAIAPDDYVPIPRIMPDGSREHWKDSRRVTHIRATSAASGTPYPPRCSRCNAYANPFFGQDGKCNFCGCRNRNIKPSDRATLEYEVTGPYITRPRPVEPIFLYALDATCPKLPAYLTIIEQVGVKIAEHYDRQTEHKYVKPRIGLVLVSSNGIVIAYLEPDTGEMSLKVVSDVTEDPFCPVPVDQWTYDLTQGVEQWKKFMACLWETWKPIISDLDAKNAYGLSAFATSCGGAAMAFMADALESTGGRATWLSWRRPNFGVGSIRDREKNNLKLYTKEDQEQKLYTPLQLQSNLEALDERAANFYTKLAEKCGKNRVCLDIVLHTLPKPMSFLDTATLAELCRRTSGRLKWIQAPQWQEQMKEELLRPPLSFFGTDAIFKVRCSNGLEVKSYLPSTAPGVSFQSNIVGSPELEISCVLPDTSIAVDFEHKIGGIHKNDMFVYIQSALLYTTPLGKRRVRVSTLALRASADPAQIYKAADFAAVTSMLTRKAISHFKTKLDEDLSKPKAARGFLLERATDIIGGYRANCAMHLPGEQLILPHKQQMLPIFVVGLTKSAMFRASLPQRGSGIRAEIASPTADERSYALFNGALANPAVSMLMAHPNIFCLTNLRGSEGQIVEPQPNGTPTTETVMAAHHKYVRLPKNVHPSIASLQDESIYLIDEGTNLYIYVGQDVPRDVKSELLEISDSGCAVSTSSDFGQTVHRMIWQMRTFSTVGGGPESTIRPSYAPVIVVLADSSHKDPFEEKVMKLMIDDEIGGHPDYITFLCGMHKRVKEAVLKGSYN